MTNMMKTTIACSISLALIGCNQTVNQPKAEFEKPLQVVAINDTHGVSNKYFSGLTQSQQKASLAFRIPGTINELLVKKGDSVLKGQVIARLDPHDYQVTLDELNARKMEAVSAHKLAKAELARVKQATDDNAIASVNLDRAVSGYERSLSAVNVVSKNIQRAQDTLSYTELKAPFDGVIGNVHLDAFEQVLPGISFIDIQDNDSLEVEIDVPENMITSFEIGQAGNVTWYQSDLSLNASVSEIAALPHVIKQTYTVTMSIDQPSPDIFPGKTVTVATEFDTAIQSYCVPYSAILGEKEQLYVNVVRDKKIIKADAEMNSLDAYTACVSSDFKSGDYVVISGSHYLREGDSATNLIIKSL